MFLRKPKALSILILASIFLSSCDFLESLNDYVDKIQFKDSSYDIYEGSLCVCYVNYMPEDSLKYYDVEFSVLDDSVCEIEEVYTDYCLVKGIKEGTTIIVSTLGKKSARAIVNVKSKGASL